MQCLLQSYCLPSLSSRSRVFWKQCRYNHRASSWIFEGKMASLTKCQPSQVLALSDSLGASHWAMNAKALTLKSFISDRFLLGTLFSCHWSFPINRFHLAHLDCLCNHHHLPYMYFLTLHTNTRAQNPQIHSSEYTLAIPTERSPSRMQKAGWRSRFCMMNCVGALFVLTFSLLLVCYLSK